MIRAKETITDRVMMIRPSNFGYNPETAVNNSFQRIPRGTSKAIAEKATVEFDNLVALLQQNGVAVEVIEDTPKPVKPDALFPNNWISFHTSGTLITYPMFAPSRRLERREDIIDTISKKYAVKRRYSFEMYESHDAFLEGTGSMVLDRVNRVCYACLSRRTDITLLNKFGLIMGYEIVHFNAFDAEGSPIYHTNVLMALGEDFVVICRAAVKNIEDWQKLSKHFKRTQKSVVEINQEQMNHFAGNMLQLKNKYQERLLVMSSQAYQCLTDVQLKVLSKDSKILHTDLNTIETYGGGSARCMIAEIFLPLV